MRSPLLVILFVLLAIVFFILAGLYWTGLEHWFAHRGRNPKHALLFAGLGVVSLVIASFVRPQQRVRA